MANTHNWPLIQGSETATELSAFTIRVKDYVPDMHKTSVTITTQADTNVLSSEFSFPVYAPNLHIGNITFEDSTAGNGNGQIDPGETIFITVPVSNTGHSISTVIKTRLFVSGNNVASNAKSVNLTSLAPGESGTAVYSYKVSPDAVPGSSFSMHVVAEAGPYNSVSSLELAVGRQVEDFETADFSKYSWQLKGNGKWEVSPDIRSEGLFGVKSGTLNNSERSELSLEGLVLCSDTISFYHKVSSELGYDFLKFYVDGEELGRWSGNDNWAKASYPVIAGNHRFSWIYEKDEATTLGTDAAWIDHIRFPAFIETHSGSDTITVLAEPASICPGDQSQLYVFVSGGTDYSYHWTPANPLNDTTIFNPLANPLLTTTYSVQVTGKNLSVAGKATVIVEPPPSAPLVSVSGDHLVSTETFGNQWYSNDGLIFGAVAQTYYPESSGVFYSITGNANGCKSDASNEVEFVYTGVNNSPENGFSVYPNPFTDKLYVEYNVKTAGHIKIVIYNAMGNEIGIIDEGQKDTGYHKAVFDGSHLAAGIYICNVISDDSLKFIRLIRIK